MQEYKTNIYEKSKKKTRKRFFYNLAIVAAICGVIYMFAFGILGLGLTIIGAVALIITLIQMKNYDDKYMGITAYGDRKEKFVINEDYFIIGEANISLSELKDLVIYVDEYEGMPREIIGVHHGGNNEINFSHKGQKFSINYIIKTKSDYRGVEKLVDRIEKQQKLTVNNRA